MRDVMRLSQGATGWNVKHEGPHSREIIELFGTDTLPTAFTPAAEGEDVRRELQQLNPDLVVTLEPVG